MEKMNIVSFVFETEIYKTKQGEEFKILHETKNERGRKWYMIEFVKSGNKLEIRKDSIESGAIIDRTAAQSKYKNQPPIEPGKQCYNNNDELFIIGERVYREGDKRKRFEISFPYTRYYGSARYDDIIHGSVSDNTKLVSKITTNERIVVGESYKNFYGAEYVVTRFVCKNVLYAKIFEVEFVVSKKRCIGREFDLLSGSIRPSWGVNRADIVEIQIGEIRTNNNSKRYEILEYIGDPQNLYTNNYKVKFLDSGNICIAEDAQILRETIQDKQIIIEENMTTIESNMSRAMSRMPMNYNPFYEPNTGMIRAMIRQPK